MAIDYSEFKFAKGTPKVLAKRQQQRDAERALREARKIVKARDGGKCRCCGKAGAEVHHLKYRSLGGEHDPSQLALLCKRCHEDIHAHLITVTFRGPNLARTVRFGRKGTR